MVQIGLTIGLWWEQYENQEILEILVSMIEF